MFSCEAACGIKAPSSRKMNKNLRCFMSGLGFYIPLKILKSAMHRIPDSTICGSGSINDFSIWLTLIDSG
jgi:hypothetical protein